MISRARLALGLVAGLAIAAAAVAVIAQPSDDDSGGKTTSSTPASSSAPPDPSSDTAPPPDDNAPAAHTHKPKADDTNSVSGKPTPPKPPPAPPPAPPAPRPVRAPTAVLQALDKVTAETMRFAAGVGQSVRYKNLVFSVKACETSGLGQPEPQSQAYVVIVFAPFATGGVAAPPPREVFRGWMYANSPSLNPFKHPVYDAWLIACMDQAPPK